MVIQQHISNEFSPLKLTETVQIALIRMEDEGVINLPVVKKNQLLGYVRAEELNALDPQTTISDVELSEGLTIRPEASLYEAIRLFGATGYDILAVSTDGGYLGSVWSKDIFKSLSNGITAQDDGAVVILKCASQDYSISQLGRIVESADGKILGLWIWQTEGTGNIEIMLKLNIQHIDNLIDLLTANGYNELHRVNYRGDDFTEERYQSLLKYLDV